MGNIMHTKDNLIPKSLGPVSACLLTTLYVRNRPVFHFQEAQEILGSRTVTSSALSQLIQHGIVMRLKGGTFRIIPFELGFEREYLGNPYIVARELTISDRSDIQKNYYLSHGAAFELHQMVTQPSLVVYVSSLKMMRPRIISGTEFRFVKCKPDDLFGLTEIWVDKNEKVCVSDLERTLLDGLKLPGYCGGMIEVAKAFSIKHDQINPQKIIDYAIRLNIGAVYRRLGYLMELYQIGDQIHRDYLKTKLTNTYQLFDPDLSREGHHIIKWRLRLNISEDELVAIRGT